MSSGDHDKFEEEKFMKILVNLKDTQESIQGFSGWCIKNRKAAYKMARCWIKVIKKVSLCSLVIISVLSLDIQHPASGEDRAEVGAVLPGERHRAALRQAQLWRTS